MLASCFCASSSRCSRRQANRSDQHWSLYNYRMVLDCSLVKRRPYRGQDRSVHPRVHPSTHIQTTHTYNRSIFCVLFPYVSHFSPESNTDRDLPIYLPNAAAREFIPYIYMLPDNFARMCLCVSVCEIVLCRSSRHTYIRAPRE